MIELFRIAGKQCWQQYWEVLHDLSRYANEQSVYVHAVRKRIEAAWQPWEESRFHCVEFNTADVPQTLVDRAQPILIPHSPRIITFFATSSRWWVIAICSQDQYDVTNASFFTHASLNADCLIANPPYLPAPDRGIRLPLLYAGADGAAPTNALLSLGFDSALLMISSFSNPAGTIRHAGAEGYIVSDFIVAPLTFGIYSSEPKVKATIESLRTVGKAFYDGNTYLLAGVLFKKQHERGTDRAAGLIKILTAL